MENKLKRKIKELKASDKKGMEALGWILTIVLTIAVVGIVWFWLQPAVDNSSQNAANAIEANTNSVLGVDE